ncbi:MAG: hypothetical protein PQJ61_14820 [Spirochaetales bacterium]|uniref:FlgN protein n=1 Tax=Candidatus Thalassospirochaeta sargassi TaxID=3119039 RepID=A0AAJ1MJY4_9SPIO|nr:hypothetical protein [Spirochaetales bacterium]
MSIDTLSEKLANLMTEETNLLNSISDKEEKLQKALRENKWDDMEIIINSLSPLSLKMEKVEAERDKTFNTLKRELNKKEDDGFYAVAMHMNDKNREDCLGGYRRMKIALLKMQGITAGIDQYVRTVGETSRAVLEEVFPHRKGRIYSNRGCEKPVQADPMILNRHL